MNAYDAFRPITTFRACVLYAVPVVAAILALLFALLFLVGVCIYHLCRIMMNLSTVRSLFAAPAIQLLKRFKPDWNPQYVTDREIEVLRDLIGKTSGTIVEIGCNEGATLARIARIAAPRLCIGVDYSGNHTMPVLQASEKPEPSRLGIKAKHLPNVKVIDCDSRVVEPQLADHRPIGLIFIDGDHSLEGVRSDTQMALRLIDNGIICWHDCSRRAPAFVKVWEYVRNHPTLNASVFPDTQIAMAIAGKLEPGATGMYD